jgi:tetratricopeptide (TPR) repeat protein
MYYYALANQYEKLGNSQRAAQNFEKAFSMNPDYKKGLIEYANFLFNTSQFDKILEVIERIEEDEALRFEYSLLKGKALMGLTRYVAAIESLLEANQIYDSHIGLLNSLGFCYYKVGSREEAIKVLKASLSLDPNQAEVKKLLNMIEKDEKGEIHQEDIENVQTSG